MVDENEIERWRWKFTTLEIFVKTLPTGDEAAFTFQVQCCSQPSLLVTPLPVVASYTPFCPQSEWPITYLYFQYRNNAGRTGADDKIALLLPTQNGNFVLSEEVKLETHTEAGVDRGHWPLTTYHVTDRQRKLGLLRTSNVHDRITSGLVATFLRMNFSLNQPFTTMIQHFLDHLPASLPGDDEIQVHNANPPAPRPSH